MTFWNVTNVIYLLDQFLVKVENCFETGVKWTAFFPELRIHHVGFALTNANREPCQTPKMELLSH